MNTLNTMEVRDLLARAYPGERPEEAAIALIVSLMFAAEDNGDNPEEFLDYARKSYLKTRKGLSHGDA